MVKKQVVRSLAFNVAPQLVTAYRNMLTSSSTSLNLSLTSPIDFCIEEFPLERTLNLFVYDLAS
jgi:hypothetical protein